MKNKQLRRNVLVCKEDVLGKVLRNDKPLTPKEKDYLLKLISVYLLNSKMNQDSVTVTLTDVYNWSLCNHKSYKLSDYRFEDGTYPINTVNNGNSIKISVNNNIKDNYRIVNAKNIDSINYGETAFIDNGSQDILSKYYIESNLDLDNLKKELD